MYHCRAKIDAQRRGLPVPDFKVVAKKVKMRRRLDDIVSERLSDFQFKTKRSMLMAKARAKKRPSVSVTIFP